MTGAFGLYTHIRTNRWRSVVLLAGLFLLLYVIVFALSLAFEALRGGPTLEFILRRAWADLLHYAPWATALAVVWIVWSYFSHQSLIDSMTGSQSVTRAEAPKLYNMLENLCISRGFPMPALKIMESPMLNAFASGMSEKQYAVTVTRGLIETLNDRELEAVLAHELTHIRNGDVRLMVIAVIIAGVISFFGEALFRWFSRGPRIRLGDGDGDRKAAPAAAALVIAVVLLLVAWLLSGVLRFALSRSREFLADAGAVELTKDPDAMISALSKIRGHAELDGVPSGIMEMCIENERDGITDLFATHPPIDQRIEALISFAGGNRSAADFVLPPPVRQPVELDRSLKPKIGPWAGRAGPRVGPWS